jgi:hypothetical protein
MRKSLDYHRIQKNPLAENFNQHTTAKAVKNGTDLSSKEFPQHISNPSEANSEPLLPSQPLNPSPKNTPLLTSAQKEAQARVQRYFRNEEIGTKFIKILPQKTATKPLECTKTSSSPLRKILPKIPLITRLFMHILISLLENKKKKFLGAGAKTPKPDFKN